MTLFLLGDGLVFDAKDVSPAVEYLKANPGEVDRLTDAMLANIRGLLGWGDTASGRDLFEALCEVLDRVKPTTGQQLNQQPSREEVAQKLLAWLGDQQRPTAAIDVDRLKKRLGLYSYTPARATTALVQALRLLENRGLVASSEIDSSTMVLYITKASQPKEALVWKGEATPKSDSVGREVGSFSLLYLTSEPAMGDWGRKVWVEVYRAGQQPQQGEDPADQAEGG